MCFYCGSDLEEELGEEELGEEVLVLVRSSSQLQQEPEAELILRPCSSLLAAAALSSAVTHVFMVSRTRPSAPGLWSLLGCGDHVPSPVAFSESVLMVMNLVLVLVLVWSWIWSWLWAWSQTWLWAWSWSQSGPGPGPGPGHVLHAFSVSVCLDVGSPGVRRAVNQFLVQQETWS